MDRYELRRQDYALTGEHIELQSAFKKFFETHCPIDVVRAAEMRGFDQRLWDRMSQMGASSMAVHPTYGGDGATLVDLTLVAEEVGRSMAPVPWIDHVCAVRMLARADALPNDAPDTAALVSGSLLAAADPRLDSPRGPRLLPAAAAADRIVIREGFDIVRLDNQDRPATVGNIGRLPMAWVDPASAATRMVLASGPDAAAAYLRMCDEWRLLTAAALVGLVEAALTEACEFATTRITRGVPISTFQAISHPLANIAIIVQGGRNLVRRAAWFLDREPDERPELAASAFCFMAEEAPVATTMAAHVQGGLGVSAESAATAYVLRARGWSLAAGDPAVTAKRVARLVTARNNLRAAV